MQFGVVIWLDMRSCFSDFPKNDYSKRGSSVFAEWIYKMVFYYMDGYIPFSFWKILFQNFCSLSEVNTKKTIGPNGIPDIVLETCASKRSTFLLKWYAHSTCIKEEEPLSIFYLSYCCINFYSFQSLRSFPKQKNWKDFKSSRLISDNQYGFCKIFSTVIFFPVCFNVDALRQFVDTFAVGLNI